MCATNTNPAERVRSKLEAAYPAFPFVLSGVSIVFLISKMLDLLKFGPHDDWIPFICTLAVQVLIIFYTFNKPIIGLMFQISVALFVIAALFNVTPPENAFDHIFMRVSGLVLLLCIPMINFTLLTGEA